MPPTASPSKNSPVLLRRYHVTGEIRSKGWAQIKGVFCDKLAAPQTPRQSQWAPGGVCPAVTPRANTLGRPGVGRRGVTKPVGRMKQRGATQGGALYFFASPCTRCYAVIPSVQSSFRPRGRTRPDIGGKSLSNFGRHRSKSGKQVAQIWPTTGQHLAQTGQLERRLRPKFGPNRPELGQLRPNSGQMMNI